MVKYKALRNEVQRMATKLRGNYYSRRVDSLRRAGPRQWWSKIKRLTGQSHQCPLNRLADNIGGSENKQVLANQINTLCPPKHVTTFSTITLTVSVRLQ